MTGTARHARHDTRAGRSAIANRLAIGAKFRPPRGRPAWKALRARRARRRGRVRAGNQHTPSHSRPTSRPSRPGLCVRFPRPPPGGVPPGTFPRGVRPHPDLVRFSFGVHTFSRVNYAKTRAVYVRADHWTQSFRRARTKKRGGWSGCRPCRRPRLSDQRVDSILCICQWSVVV